MATTHGDPPDKQSSQPAAAIAQLFENAELTEMILLQTTNRPELLALHPEDRLGAASISRKVIRNLFQLQRVSKHFHATISRSVKLRKTMFLSPRVEDSALSMEAWSKTHHPAREFSWEPWKVYHASLSLIVNPILYSSTFFVPTDPNHRRRLAVRDNGERMSTTISCETINEKGHCGILLSKTWSNSGNDEFVCNSLAKKEKKLQDPSAIAAPAPDNDENNATWRSMIAVQGTRNQSLQIRVRALMPTHLRVYQIPTGAPGNFEKGWDFLLSFRGSITFGEIADFIEQRYGTFLKHVLVEEQHVWVLDDCYPEK